MPPRNLGHAVLVIALLAALGAWSGHLHAPEAPAWQTAQLASGSHDGPCLACRAAKEREAGPACEIEGPIDRTPALFCAAVRALSLADPGARTHPARAPPFHG